MKLLLLLLASLLAGQDSVTSGEIRFRTPAEYVEAIRFTDRAVPRLRYAIELRDELRKLGRLCDHAEDWERTLRAISEGATLIEMAVCHHEKKTRRTLYRVAARWLEIREYPEASVVEGVERR